MFDKLSFKQTVVAGANVSEDNEADADSLSLSDAEVEATWAALDRDGNGSVTPAELEQGIVAHLAASMDDNKPVVTDSSGAAMPLRPSQVVATSPQSTPLNQAKAELVSDTNRELLLTTLQAIDARLRVVEDIIESKSAATPATPPACLAALGRLCGTAKGPLECMRCSGVHAVELQRQAGCGEPAHRQFCLT